MRMLMAALLAALACPQATLAAEKLDPQLIAAARDAQARGAEMFSYDQAAWHATDQLQLDLSRSQGTTETPLQRSLRGYIVEPGEGGKLNVVFFGGPDQTPVALVRYVMSGSDVVSGGVVQADGERGLSPLALKMVAARAKAVERMRTEGHGLCTQTSANTLILPPDGSHPMSVYVLSSTTENDHYPAGGHYRFDFDENNQLISERAFMKSCIDINTEPKEGARAAYFVLSHLLDDTPTEIHAFVSNYVPIPMLVITASNKQSWIVSKGRIEVSGSSPKR